MNEIRELAQRLGDVPQFRNIPSEEVVSIIQMGDLRNYSQGEIIFHEDDECAGMFVLIKGKVILNKLGPEGQEGVINALEPVIMFNEVAALDGGPNPVSAAAQADCRLWHISRENMQALILQYPQIGLSLLGVLAMRNRQLVNYYSDLSFRSVHARLAKHLLDLSRQGENPIDRKQNPIRLMAARIITTPEAISRTLRTFSSTGLIQYNRLEIQVSDLDGLNEAGMRLGMLVGGRGVGQFAGLMVDVHVALAGAVDAVGPVQAGVEPLRRVGRRDLAGQHAAQLVVEGLGIFLAVEVAVAPAPIRPGVGQPVEDLAGVGLTAGPLPLGFRHAGLAEVLLGQDVGRDL